MVKVEVEVNSNISEVMTAAALQTAANLEVLRKPKEIPETVVRTYKENFGGQ